MDFLIFGGGAVGTYLGTCLAHAGQKVVVLEREKDISGLREEGLKLELNGVELSAPGVEFVSNIQEIRELNPDLGILAFKTYHLDSILPDLIELKDSLPPLLCLQNGVESEDILAAALGCERVIAGTVTSAVDRVQKGRALVRKNRGVGLAGDHTLMKGLLAIFQQAGLNPRHYHRADAMKWSKLLTNLLGNASSAILDLSPAEIYSHPGLYRLELAQIRECLQVMGKLSIPPVNLPGVPVKILAWVVRFLPAFLSQRLLSRVVGRGRGEKMPSFHIDLYSGKGMSEVDQLNGAVVRAGEQVGCPTPVNKYLTKTLSALLKGDLPVSSYQGKPELMLKDFGEFRDRAQVSG